MKTFSFPTRSMTHKPRIAFVRVMQETNALSPALTELEDFRPVWSEGNELLKRCGRFGMEAPKLVRNAELSGFVRGIRECGDAELIPLFSAWAIPSGPLSESCFNALSERLHRELEAAAPLDGVYVCLHGSMGAVGEADPETRLLEVARSAAPHAKIVASHDLHANVTDARVKAVDALIGYRTNPHRDFFDTGRKCARLLLRMIRQEVRVKTSFRSLPMILGGGNTVDFLNPMRPIFRRMKEMEKDPRVLAVSLFMVHPFLAAEEVGWSVVAITDGNKALADKLAEELAELAWATRDEKPIDFFSPSDALADARSRTLARRVGCVVLADASDVVSAGAPGENTALLRELWEHGEGLLCYVPIRDTQASIDLAGKPLGSAVEVDLGAKIDPVRGIALRVRGTLVKVHRDPQFRTRVLLELDAPTRRHGKIKLVITEGPALAMKPNFFSDLSLPIRDADIVIVKNFFPFRLYFLPYAVRTIYVKTKGITDLDASFDCPIKAPVHPRDQVSDWRAVDARRRGVTSTSIGE